MARAEPLPRPTECRALKEKLAALYGLAPENIFLANGSDDILNFAFMAFCDQNRPVAFPNISYGFYPVYAKLHGIPAREIPLREGFVLAAEDYCGLDSNIVIANPNAPSGRAIPVSDIEQILRTNPDHVVVVDEAYVNFGARELPTGSLTTTTTFWCADLLQVPVYGRRAAGFCPGQSGAHCRPQQTQIFHQSLQHQSPHLGGRRSSVDSNDYYVRNCRIIAENRTYTVSALAELGFETVPSVANFIFSRPPSSQGKELYIELKKRVFWSATGINRRSADYVRITIGSREQMDTFLKRTREILKEG